MVLLQAASGDCPEDMSLLAGDDCLERGLGFALPKTSAVRGFLNRFHDEDLELARPPREVQKSFIMPSSEPVQGPQSVLACGVRRTAKLYAAQGQPLRIATVDQDATIIESHKESALPRPQRSHRPRAESLDRLRLAHSGHRVHLRPPVKLFTIPTAESP